MDERKKLVWMGRSLKDLSAFPFEAKQDLGFALHLLQIGQTPSDFKPMSDVGAGVYELICKTGAQSVDHRVFYVAKFAEAIYVLHAFEKKTQQTPKADIRLGKVRYAEMLELRKSSEPKGQKQ
jgi:phage-related protein